MSALRKDEVVVWRIWCRVSGGVLGTREAFTKGADGAEQRFETFEEAEAEAARLRARPRLSTARFEYRPVPLPIGREAFDRL